MELNDLLEPQLAEWRSKRDKLVSKLESLQAEMSFYEERIKAAVLLLGEGPTPLAEAKPTKKYEKPPVPTEGPWAGMGLTEVIGALLTAEPFLSNADITKQLVADGYPFKRPNRAAQAVGLTRSKRTDGAAKNGHTVAVVKIPRTTETEVVKDFAF